MTGRMDTFGLTDTGLMREENHDQFLIADLKKSVVIHHTSLSYDDETHLFGGSQAKLLLVADGAGDNPGGVRASQVAVQGIVQYLLNTMHWLFRLDDRREQTILEELKAALAFTQNKIRRHSQCSESQVQSGAMITLAYIVWPQVYMIHVGDSRAYLLRDKGLTRLTPESSQFELSLHDKLLLCTDGLTTHLTDDAIETILKCDLSAEEACVRLVNAANDSGGQDNTTVVLAHFTDRMPERTKEKAETIGSSKAAKTVSHARMLAPDLTSPAESDIHKSR